MKYLWAWSNTLEEKKQIRFENYKVLTFWLEDDNYKKCNFRRETMTFTLQIVKIWSQSSFGHNESKSPFGSREIYFLSF